MSIPNAELTGDIHVKLHKSVKKVFNTVGFYRAFSHGVRSYFLSEVERITNSSSSWEINNLYGDTDVDLLKLSNVGKT